MQRLNRVLAQTGVVLFFLNTFVRINIFVIPVEVGTHGWSSEKVLELVF